MLFPFLFIYNTHLRARSQVSLVYPNSLIFLEIEEFFFNLNYIFPKKWLLVKNIFAINIAMVLICWKINFELWDFIGNSSHSYMKKKIP